MIKMSLPKIDLLKVVSFLETTFPKVIIIFTPIFASTIPVIFLYENLFSVMELSNLQAVIISIASEGIGISSIAVYQSVKQFNKRYKDKKNHVSTKPTIAAYIIYLLSIIFTNGLLEIEFGLSPKAVESIAAVLLSLLSLSGALLLSTNQAVQFVETKNKRKPTGNQGKRNGNKRKPAGNHGKHNGNNPESFPVFRIKSKDELTPEMITHLTNGHTPETLRNIFPDVTQRTIRNWKNALKQ